MKTSAYDLVILGGGCAGLSLARELARAEKRGLEIPRTLVLEAGAKIGGNKTWCYWEPDESPALAPHETSWKAWHFSSGKGREQQVSEKWRYACLPAAAFFEAALREVRGASRITLKTGFPAERIVPSGNSLAVRTAEGLLECSQLVDTRPPPLEWQRSSKLFQVFHGLEIRAKRHCANTGSVGLMEEMESDRTGFRFDYVLPLAEDRLLVEATRFSSFPLTSQRTAKDLKTALARIVPSGNFKILREEFGIIPMGLPVPKAAPDSRWIYAGTRGGAVRAATGYAFADIQKWAAACAAKLVQAGIAMAPEPLPGLLRGMDSLFLSVLRDRPELAPELFMAIAGGLSPDRFVRFMTGTGGIRDAFAVMRCLPPMPFVKQLIAEIGTSALPDPVHGFSK